MEQDLFITLAQLIKTAFKSKGAVNSKHLIYHMILQDSNDSNINLSFKPNQYVACMYDRHWWIGVIVTVDDCNSNLDIFLCTLIAQL